MKTFDQVLADLIAGKKTVDEFADEAINSMIKDRSSERLLDSQRNEIQRLNKVQELLISELIKITDKPYQKSTEYWLDIITKRC